MTVILALSYSGRDEIVRLIQQIAREARAQDLDPDQIDEESVAARLDTTGCRTRSFDPYQR